jgi:hypothetical protein
MKILKKTAVILLVILAIPLVMALFISNDASYEKSIIINAPVETVWKHIATFDAQSNWSPWSEYDATMNKSIEGVDGTIGAIQSWESDHEKVGKGSQTITNIVNLEKIETNLKFLVPYESEAKGFIRIKAEENGIKVTWGFESEMPYPFNLMKLFMNLEEMMEEDWSFGLNKLKMLCEDD